MRRIAPGKALVQHLEISDICEIFEATGVSFVPEFDLSDLDFLLPQTYVPGSTISGSSTWIGKSLADLGFASTNRVEVIIKGRLGGKINKLRRRLQRL